MACAHGCMQVALNCSMHAKVTAVQQFAESASSACFFNNAFQWSNPLAPYLGSGRLAGLLQVDGGTRLRIHQLQHLALPRRHRHRRRRRPLLLLRARRTAARLLPGVRLLRLRLLRLAGTAAAAGAA